MPSKSLTTTENRAGPRKRAWYVHPGEILREEFLRPLKLSVYQLAKALHVPAPRINDIVLEKRAITADTALRLSRYFGTSEQFWMNLQSSYEVRRAKSALGPKLTKIKPRVNRREGAA